ncbi:FliM/FliN family flagellar motor switch protein [Jannaschia sp. KMU-145]|uniref:FliM/FliN family flagellar motor switch protein n=1 Tax=Jannaschia halovivens TaxID=3388667 RepID=UPI00396B353F
MTTDPAPSILSRMVGRRPEAAAPGGAVAAGPLRALVTALRRVGEATSALDIDITERKAVVAEGEAALEGLHAQSLCFLIDPPGLDPHAPPEAEVLSRVTGVVVLEPKMVDALIEVQTLGRVDGPGREPRRPTRIDAALAQPFTRAVLGQVDRILPADSEDPRPGKLRTDSFVAGPDPLPMLLTAPRMLRLEVGLTLGGGQRSARIVLMLPLPEAPAAVGETLPAERDWAADLSEVVRAAPVRLEAVLPPLRISLATLTALEVGDVLPLPPTSLSELTLHGGASGVSIPGRHRTGLGMALPARLGQLNGARAVKLGDLPGQRAEPAPPAPDLAAPPPTPAMPEP